MRAAVLVNAGQIELQDVPRAEPRQHEVLVRVKAVGLCGTDWHIASGEANYNCDASGRPLALAEHPQILGHEIAGVVEEAGDAGTSRPILAVGDRVAIDQGRTCVSEHRALCEYCVTGDSHQCEFYREHGITGLPGGFAEYVTVPAVNAVRIADSTPFEQAALVEPLGCIVHSMCMVERARTRYRLRVAGDERPVRTVLVCGGGPAGQLFTQYLRNVVHFEGLVLLSDPNPLKRSLAERWGATAIDPFAVDLVARVRELTDGRGVELLIEASGAGGIFHAIPGLIRKQATVLIYGHGHAGVDLSVMNQVQFREPTLVTPAGASGGHDALGRPTTYQQALDCIEAGVIDVGTLITHRYTSLGDVPRALAGDHRQPGYVKGVVLL